MSDISSNIQTIRTAVFGREIRTAIADSIEAMESELSLGMDFKEEHDPDKCTEPGILYRTWLFGGENYILCVSAPGRNNRTQYAFIRLDSRNGGSYYGIHARTWTSQNGFGEWVNLFANINAITSAVNEYLSSHPIEDLSNIESDTNKETTVFSSYYDSGDPNENIKYPSIGAVKQFSLTNIVSTPEAFGAVGNGIADDTVAIQSAIDYAINNNVKFSCAPNKVYAISAPLEIVILSGVNQRYIIPENRVSEFDFNGAVLIPCNNIEAPLKCAIHFWKSIRYANGSISNEAAICATPTTTLKNITIVGSLNLRQPSDGITKGFKFDDGDANTSVENDLMLTTEKIHTGVYIQRSRQDNFENIRVHNTRRGIYMCDSEESKISKCFARRMPQYESVLDLSNVDSDSELSSLYEVFQEPVNDDNPNIRREIINGGVYNLDYTQCVGFELNTEDAFISDCVAVDYIIGLKIQGGDTKVYGCHMWNSYKDQVNHACCFYNSGYNFYTDCTCDRFHIGFYNQWNVGSSLNGMLFTNQGIATEISSDNHYCFYLADVYGIRAKGVQIHAVNTRLNGSRTKAIRQTHWCNLVPSHISDIQTEGVNISDYYNFRKGATKKVRLKTIIKNFDGLKPYEDSDGYRNGFRVGTTSGEFNGDFWSQNLTLETVLENEEYVHTANVANGNERSYVWLGGRSSDVGKSKLVGGHKYYVSFYYKYNTDTSITRSVKLFKEAVPSALSIASKSLEPSADWKRAEVFYDLSDWEDNEIALLRIGAAFSSSSGIGNGNHLISLKNVAVFDITGFTRYFLENKGSFDTRQTMWCKENLTDIIDYDLTANYIPRYLERVKLKSLEFPLDFDTQVGHPHAATIELYKVRYNEYGHPLICENGIGDASTSTDIPYNVATISNYGLKATFDSVSIISDKVEGKNLIPKLFQVVDSSASPVSYTYDLSESKGKWFPLGFYSDSGTITVKLFPDRWATRTVLSLRIGSELGVDTPLVPDGGYIQQYEKGKIYAVCINFGSEDGDPNRLPPVFYELEDM